MDFKWGEEMNQPSSISSTPLHAENLSNFSFRDPEKGIVDTPRELDVDFIGRGEVRGFKFHQLLMSKHAYLYQVQNESTLYYEVFERRVNLLYKTVTYPKSSSFGVWAWTFKSKHQANEKFNSLTR